MTGLNLKAFKALESSFEEAYQQSLNQPEKERKRQQGGGRKATLRMNDIGQNAVDPNVYKMLSNV